MLNYIAATDTCFSRVNSYEVIYEAEFSYLKGTETCHRSRKRKNFIKKVQDGNEYFMRMVESVSKVIIWLHKYIHMQRNNHRIDFSFQMAARQENIIPYCILIFA